MNLYQSLQGDRETYKRLLALAEREHRSPQDQVDYMFTVILDVFEKFPQWTDRFEHSRALLEMIRESESGQALIEAQLRVDRLERTLKEARQQLDAVHVG